MHPAPHRLGWCVVNGGRTRNAGQEAMSSRDALIVTLPASAAEDAPARWWRVVDGVITRQGWSDEWIAIATPAPGEAKPFLLGIAPAADLVLRHAAFPSLSPRQAEAAARLIAAEDSVTPAADLHVAVGDADGDGQRPLIALDRSALRRWLDGFAALGLEADAIAPAPALMPAPDDSQTWIVADIGTERILRSRDTAFIDDPVLTRHIIGDAATVTEIAPERIDAALVAACDAPPLDLRTGTFAARPASWLTSALLRRMAWLIGAIIVVSLAIGIARWVRVGLETRALDAEAVAEASSVLRPAPATVEQALPALDARLAALGGGSGNLASPLAALVAAMEPVPNVAVDALQWRGDGTLTVTLGAPRMDDINPVLLTLQANGYIVTAQPRSGTDGRALGDITIRSNR